MSAIEVKKNRTDPLVLIKNKSYPAYQLAATTSGKTAPETVLIIVVLETMKWLRGRFKDFDTPTEIKLSEPANYENVTYCDFKSFHINKGYKLDVIWLPEDNNWCLQLTEPDLGPRTGKDDERSAVPGRLIETNIVYRVVAGKVECGFKVIISEPEDEEIPCEVYRLAVIKQLATNPYVGLAHKYPLLREESCLSKIGDIKKLAGWLADKERMLPAIIALGKSGSTSEQVPEFQATTLPILSVPKEKIVGDVISSPSKINILDSLTPKLKLSDIDDASGSDSDFIIDINALASSKMGYGQYFCIPANLIPDLNKFTERSNANRFREGDLLFWEPRLFNARTPQIYSASDQRSRMKAITDELDTTVQNYSLNKPFEFGSVLFYDSAIIREKELDIESDFKLQEIKAFYEKQLEEITAKNNSANEAKDRTILEYEKDCENLREQLVKLGEKEDPRIEEYRLENSQLRKELADKGREIERLIFIQSRPKDSGDVVGWVAEHFGGKLIFHDRAVDLMKKVKNDEVNLDDLCNALEYLAVDYRDFRMGLITEDDLHNVSGEKYGRPFSVSPTGSGAIEMYAKDYKIKYGEGHKGRSTEKPLNLHLKIGNSAENLLRIYFLYDPENKLVVVGSLPRHLSTTKLG